MARMKAAFGKSKQQDTESLQSTGEKTPTKRRSVSESSASGTKKKKSTEATSSKTITSFFKKK